MMATVLRPEALHALPRVAPGSAALAEALVALLEADGIGASIVRDAPAGPWFACPDGVRFRVPGGPALAPERVGDAVALLDRADPLLMRIERALGVTFEPETVDDGEPEPGLILSLAAEDVGVTIAFPLDHRAGPQWEAQARALRPAESQLPLVLRLLVAGPRIGVDEAGALAAGDLVLIGARPGATIEASDGAARTGQLDLFSGSFTLHPEGNPMAADSAAPRDFAVPLTVRLPERATSAASLATLRPGTALPLGPITEGMPVELLVAGRLLARGELVQLGDRFAVLIEERAGIEDVDARPIEVEVDGAEAQA
ncbi:MAG: FliM/FliN family flagellar motor switch protein [Sphingomonas sp.]|uniref:FliM/FliN family flagellar motor switch protein n=1 Tax=Sphingomonas sp. TaxID=28214 RepID=UPI001B105825|nr:FliM/FliN family flagellar motor switch protein [Sphingomonas sp.]MBO9623400.1 FliM/FliN family flagellar motor switch protein [Sphingomonas sp.]